MIAIKDMKMPKWCPGCPLYDNEYGWCKANKDIVINFDERPSNCPFIETTEVQDAVSRQDAIDAISSMFAPTPTQKDMVEDCLEIIENLPSAELSDEYRKGWHEGREALRKEMWEDGRDRLD